MNKLFIDNLSLAVGSILPMAKCIESSCGLKKGNLIQEFKLGEKLFDLFDNLTLRTFPSELVNLEFYHYGPVSILFSGFKVMGEMFASLGADSNGREFGIEIGCDVRYCWYFDKDHQVLEDGESNSNVFYGVFLFLSSKKQHFKILHYENICSDPIKWPDPDAKHR